jgi:hypothetical protein
MKENMEAKLKRRMILATIGYYSATTGICVAIAVGATIILTLPVALGTVAVVLTLRLMGVDV